MPPRPRRRSIPRIALVLMLWLVVGAVVTVGVAWGSVWMTRRSVGPLGKFHDKSTYPWPEQVPGSWPGCASYRDSSTNLWEDFAEWKNMYVHQSWANYSQADPDISMRYELLGQIRVGLPMRCAWHTVLIESADKRRKGSNSHRGAWTLPNPIGGVDALPITPLWPGFALNTLFYAALVWVLWQISSALRRRSRRRTNRCVQCGYDRAGIRRDAKCPECGA